MSETFGRVVAAQAIDAISFLHSHAVIHRDIKPDNLIVTGASASDDSIWNEAADPAASSWEDLCKKWFVILIDFGFARALTPDDVVKPSLEIKRENLDASYHVNKMTEAIKRSESLDGSNGRSSRRLSIGASSPGRNSIRGFRRNYSRHESSGSNGDLNKSISGKMMRTMSALGNRNFAAPEIIDKVHEENHVGLNNTEQEEVDVTDTISNFVSEYGLLVDAYSLGCTIRYMMTGVQPHIRVESVVAERKSMGYRMGRWLGKKTGSIDKNARKKRIVLISDLPGDFQRLISAMTEKNQKSRMSVRSAKRCPYIYDVLENGDAPPNDQKDEIKYLSIVMKHVSPSTPHTPPRSSKPVAVVAQEDDHEDAIGMPLTP